MQGGPISVHWSFMQSEKWGSTPLKIRTGSQEAATITGQEPELWAIGGQQKTERGLREGDRWGEFQKADGGGMVGK